MSAVRRPARKITPMMPIMRATAPIMRPTIRPVFGFWVAGAASGAVFGVTNGCGAGLGLIGGVGPAERGWPGVLVEC